jgi:hypothetical protein
MRVVDSRIEAMDKALVLQSEEIARRLLELNHIKAERENYLQKNIYEIKTDYYDRWIITIEKRMSVQETRSLLWLSVIGGGVVLLQLLIHWWI